MSPTTKRRRRTQSDMAVLFEGVVSICDEYTEAISVRHLFYRCCGQGFIEKSEASYGSLQKFLVKWRRERRIPFDWFVDGSRSYFGAKSFDTLGDYVAAAASSYRRNLWQGTGYFVEIWTEKLAVASSICRIAAEWNLQVFTTRGDPSMSSLAHAASTFKRQFEQDNMPVILYLGDYDETGMAIPKTIQRNLLDDHDCKVELVRVGVNEDHIPKYDLPTRPPKGEARGQSVEWAVDIDSMRPAIIRELLTAEIERLVDPDELQRLKLIEDAERETLRDLRFPMEGGA
jgi:hypothetical protein